MRWPEQVEKNLQIIMTFGDFNELFDFLNQCHMTQEEIGLSSEQLESDSWVYPFYQIV